MAVLLFKAPWVVRWPHGRVTAIPPVVDNLWYRHLLSGDLQCQYKYHISRVISISLLQQLYNSGQKLQLTNPTGSSFQYWKKTVKREGNILPYCPFDITWKDIFCLAFYLTLILPFATIVALAGSASSKARHTYNIPHATIQSKCSHTGVNLLSYKHATFH